MSLSLSRTVSGLLRCFRVSQRLHDSSSIRICSVEPTFFVDVAIRNYAADSGGKKSKLSATTGKMKEFPVEKDPHKLVTYCCGVNYFQTGEDVKLKPDSEYPDWLYDIEIGREKTLKELDPNTKEYWIQARKLAIIHQNALFRLRVKVLKQFK